MKYFILSLWLFLTVSSSAIAFEKQDIIVSDNQAKAYLNKYAPGGVISKYSCSLAKFNFDGRTECNVECRDGFDEIFNFTHVKKAYFSRSDDRIALVIDLFEESKYIEGNDTFASFASTVSCAFKSMKPVFFENK